MCCYESLFFVLSHSLKVKLPWLKLCHNTPTPARAPRHWVGTIFSLISSLRNSIHPPEMEKPPPKMACGCPHSRLINNGHTCNLHTQWNAFVNVQLHAGWHLECSDDGHYTNSPKHLSFLYNTVLPKKHRSLKHWNSLVLLGKGSLFMTEVPLHAHNSATVWLWHKGSYRRTALRNDILPGSHKVWWRVVDVNHTNLDLLALLIFTILQQSKTAKMSNEEIQRNNNKNTLLYLMQTSKKCFILHTYINC